jgi:pimeloyl-ACP methyl ester carboxylesterase
MAAGTALRDDVLRIRGGRRLAYAEWGDPTGTPLFFFHAVPGSRLWFDEPATAARGVRLVTTDRPGYGRSDLKEGASLLSWAEDFEQLSSHLGIDRCAIVAWSMGCPYALAVAARFPKQVTRLGLLSISHLPPDERPESMTPPPEPDVQAAASDPAGLIERWCVSEEWRVYAEQPESILEGLPEVDKRMLDELGYRPELEENIREGMRQGLRGMLWEEVAMLRPWGFRLADIGVETHVWRGGHETALAREFVAERLPRAQLTVWRDEGHCGFIRRWDEVLATVIA